MKRFTITTLIGLLFGLQTGCGIIEELSRACVPGDLQHICRAVFGKTPVGEAKQHIVKEVEPLPIPEPAVTEEDLNELLQQIAQLRLMLEFIQVSMVEDFALAQQAIDDIVIRLAELETNLMVTEIIDPCGDGAGFDEVLLRLSDGQIISYFEQGNKRFLTSLPPGNYRTTDQQACNFTITNDMEIL